MSCSSEQDVKNRVCINFSFLHCSLTKTHNGSLLVATCCGIRLHANITFLDHGF